MGYLYKIGFWIILIINLVFGGILMYQKSMLKDFLISSYTEKSEMVDSSYVEKESDVLIKNIERVAKLTLVEHNFVDVFTYSDYQTWDHPFFRKKMIVKSNARVGIGLDVSKLQLEANQVNKQILIKSIPVPEVLFMEDQPVVHREHGLQLRGALRTRPHLPASVLHCSLSNFVLEQNLIVL